MSQIECPGCGMVLHLTQYRPPEESWEIPPETAKRFAEMRRNFHESREKYRVKSFEALCKRLEERWNHAS